MFDEIKQNSTLSPEELSSCKVMVLDCFNVAQKGGGKSLIQEILLRINSKFNSLGDSQSQAVATDADIRMKSFLMKLGLCNGAKFAACFLAPVTAGIGAIVGVGAGEAYLRGKIDQTTKAESVKNKTDNLEMSINEELSSLFEVDKLNITNPILSHDDQSNISYSPKPPHDPLNPNQPLPPDYIPSLDKLYQQSFNKFSQNKTPENLPELCRYSYIFLNHVQTIQNWMEKREAHLSPVTFANYNKALAFANKIITDLKKIGLLDDVIFTDIVDSTKAKNVRDFKQIIDSFKLNLEADPNNQKHKIALEVNMAEDVRKREEANIKKYTKEKKEEFVQHSKDIFKKEWIQCSISNVIAVVSMGFGEMPSEMNGVKEVPVYQGLDHNSFGGNVQAPNPNGLYMDLNEKMRGLAAKSFGETTGFGHLPFIGKLISELTAGSFIGIGEQLAKIPLGDNFNQLFQNGQKGAEAVGEVYKNAAGDLVRNYNFEAGNGVIKGAAQGLANFGKLVSLGGVAIGAVWGSRSPMDGKQLAVDQGSIPPDLREQTIPRQVEPDENQPTQDEPDQTIPTQLIPIPDQTTILDEQEPEPELEIENPDLPKENTTPQTPKTPLENLRAKIPNQKQLPPSSKPDVDFETPQELIPTGSITAAMPYPVITKLGKSSEIVKYLETIDLENNEEKKTSQKVLQSISVISSKLNPTITGRDFKQISGYASEPIIEQKIEEEKSQQEIEQETQNVQKEQTAQQKTQQELTGQNNKEIQTYNFPEITDFDGEQISQLEKVSFKKLKMQIIKHVFYSKEYANNNFTSQNSRTNEENLAIRQTDTLKMFKKINTELNGSDNLSGLDLVKILQNLVNNSNTSQEEKFVSGKILEIIPEIVEAEKQVELQSEQIEAKKTDNVAQIVQNLQIERFANGLNQIGLVRQVTPESKPLDPVYVQNSEDACEVFEEFIGKYAANPDELTLEELKNYFGKAHGNSWGGKNYQNPDKRTLYYKEKDKWTGEPTDKFLMLEHGEFRQKDMQNNYREMSKVVASLALKYGDPFEIKSDRSFVDLFGVDSKPANFKGQHFYPTPDSLDQYVEQMRLRIIQFLKLAQNKDSIAQNKETLVTIIAQIYQYAANGRFYRQINNSVNMNFVNLLLRVCGYQSISHGILDHIAQRFQPKNFEKYFADYLKNKQPRQENEIHKTET